MWYLDYYVNGKRVKKAVSTYKETAEIALKKIEVQMAEGKYLDVKRETPISFKEFAEKFRQKHIRRKNRSIRNQEYLLNGLVKHFGKKYLHLITRNDIDEHLQQREIGYSASTVNKDLTMLKSMFNRANEWGDLNEYNPVRDIKRLEENNERLRFLTQEEQDRLLSNCGGVTRMIVLVALKSGMRWQEIVNLKWKQAPVSNYVDFDNNSIYVHAMLTKSKKSRTIPLLVSLKQALMDFPQRTDSGYIFENPKTKKPYGHIRRSFKTALEKSEIEDFHFHDLRHCFASDLVMKGVDLFTVQKLLGHSTPRMTQRYAHLSPDFLRSAINVLDVQKDTIPNFSPSLVPKTKIEIKEKISIP